MSRDEKISSLTFSVLVLSLECVLKGLLTHSEARTWLFHAIAAGFGTWAAISMNSTARQLTMVAGLVAVLNQGLILAQDSISLRFLLPSCVLGSVSIAGLYLTLIDQKGSETRKTFPQAPQSEKSLGLTGLGNRPNLSRSGPLPNRPNPMPSFLNVPISTGELLSIVGALSAWYSLSVAAWYNLDKWFGLRSTTVGFGELRQVREGFDELNAVSAAYLSIGYLLTYAVSGIVLISSILLRTRWSLERFRPILLLMCLAPVMCAWQVALVVELSNETDGSILSTGPWVGVLGLGLITAGSIFQRV